MKHNKSKYQYSTVELVGIVTVAIVMIIVIVSIFHNTVDGQSWSTLIQTLAQ